MKEGGAPIAPGAPIARRMRGAVLGRRAAWWEAPGRGGAPLVLLHGSGTDAAMLAWGEAVPALAGPRAVLAPELPGYGGTATLRRPYSVPRLGAWAAAFIRERCGGPVDLGGSSMGGAAALWVALEHPQLVRRLILVSTYGLGGAARRPRLAYAASRLPISLPVMGALAASERLTRRVLSEVYADPARISADVVARSRRAALTQARTGAFRAFVRAETGREHFRTDLSGRLRELAMPVLLVHGLRDRVIPASAARRAAEAAPRARLVLLDTGHLPAREDPAGFNAALAGFLDG